VTKTTLQGCFLYAKQRLKEARISEYELDARLLCNFSLGYSKLDFVTNPDILISEKSYELLEQVLEKRLSGMPVYRIIGTRDFYGLQFNLSSETLEPRPDTEVIVDQVLDFIKDLNKPIRILDLGTGTGALALALLSQLPFAHAVGVDISQQAIETARKNAILNNLEERFTALKSDLFETVSGVFDVVVSNPPYIQSGIIPQLSREVKDHDPLIALDGGIDGLDFYRRIALNSSKYLVKNGMVCVEIGFDQAIDITDIFHKNGYKLLQLRHDLGGRDRSLIFTLQ
jgi:release factor glutamine methyltransferase